MVMMSRGSAVHILSCGFGAGVYFSIGGRHLAKGEGWWAFAFFVLCATWFAVAAARIRRETVAGW